MILDEIIEHRVLTDAISRAKMTEIVVEYDVEDITSLALYHYHGHCGEYRGDWQSL